MNQKIKILADQCYQGGIPAIGIEDYFNEEKFAKLILDECFDELEEVANSSGSGPWYDGYLAGIAECERRIKQRFGTE